MPKILFIGDIVGKPGRKILREVLPQWREKYQPDAVIVNVENIAHGKGVTVKILDELQDLQIDAYTSGNHVFDKLELAKEAFEKYPNLIRPANYSSLGEEKAPVPGHGYFRFSKPVAHSVIARSASDEAIFSNGKIASDALAMTQDADKSARYTTSNQQFLILNLNATVFMKEQFDGEIANPFLAINKLLLEQAQKNDIILVDFHSEATSEKVAFGYYCDGRVTAVLGTHTHVPTADARILPGGTAYISDVGMTGALNSVLGVKKQNALDKFLDPSLKFKNELEEEGVLQINGVLIEADDSGKAAKIEKLYQEI